MAIFTKESLESLRQKVDLVDLLSAHIDLKRTGAAYKALCPFHDEKTPSFTIQKGDTHYHCFGCGAHGDAIQFLMSHLKMTFSDAVESLAQRFHVHLEKSEDIHAYKGPSKALLKEALEQASRFYHFILLHTPEGHAALQYLFKRGLDLDFIRLFQIGLAPQTPGMLRKCLHDKSINDEIMKEAGLLSGTRDFFSDRITFPIRDAAGAVIGFSARKYKEETFGGKYVNTSETPLFKKSKVLFGLNYSRRRIAKERKAIIVEGQIDALRLIQEGFNITVAGQGTAFGEGHAKELINLGVHLIYLALDNDPAGQQAAAKIGHIFQKEGVEVRVVRMPLKHDPDLYLRTYGPQAFLQLLEKSIDYLTFIVDYQTKQLNVNSPAGKNELIQTIAQQIRSWDQPVMVHESLRKLAELTNTPEHMVGVGQEFVPNIHIKQSANLGLQTIEPDRILEGDFLRWLLLMGRGMPQFIEIARLNISPEHLHVSVCQHVYTIFLDEFQQNNSCDLLTLMSRLDDPQGQLLLNEIMEKRINKDRAEQHFMETAKRIIERNWMERCEEIRRKLHSGESSDDEATELSKQFSELRRSPPKLKVEKATLAIN
jgi:DNA primase